MNKSNWFSYSRLYHGSKRERIMTPQGYPPSYTRTHGDVVYLLERLRRKDAGIQGGACGSSFWVAHEIGRNERHYYTGAEPPIPPAQS